MAGLKFKFLVFGNCAVLMIAGALAGTFLWSDISLAFTLRPNSMKTVGRGKLLYKEHCASCHAADLKGQPNWKERNAEGKLPAPPHDQSGHTWHHGDTLLLELTKFGSKKFVGADYKTDMPAFEGVLSDGEIHAILSYIKSTWPVKIRKRHDHLNATLQQQRNQK